MNYNTHSEQSRHFIFWGVITGIIILFLLVTTFSAYLKNRKLQNYAVNLTKEIHTIQQESVRLERETNALTNDPVYIEMLIREQLKMSRPNEVGIYR
ncbi:MAG: septum formation initiator family protein [Planctomycetes bacterium]|nr:septum formation initiator family protein [Planctomycetota bacterium]